MSLPVPDVFLSIVEVGASARVGYECPAVDEDVELVLEPGERLVDRFAGEFRGPLGILSASTSIVVTDRRCAWIDTRFAEGASWSRLQVHDGVHDDGRREVAAGHVRHEWLAAVRLRRQRDATGTTSSYVDLVAMTSQGDRVLTGFFADDLADRAAEVVVRAAAERWLAEGADLLDAQESQRLREHARTHVVPGPAGTTEWVMPRRQAAVELMWRLAGTDQSPPG
jgi:hypothetical protein